MSEYNDAQSEDTESLQPGYTSRSDICVRCPQGCEIHTIVDPDGNIHKLTGNRCKLGREYVEQEIRDPRRVLPTTVRVRGGSRPLVPVWTPDPIPKHLLLELAKASRNVKVDAPVHIGDVVLDDWRGLGIQLVASGEVPKTEA